MTEKKIYNCRACGGTHDNIADLQACHKRKKQAELSGNVPAPPVVQQQEKKKEMPGQVNAVPDDPGEDTPARKEIPVAEMDGMFRIPSKFLPAEVEFMSEGQYLRLNILGTIQGQDFVGEEVEIDR